MIGKTVNGYTVLECEKVDESKGIYIILAFRPLHNLEWANAEYVSAFMLENASEWYSGSYGTDIVFAVNEYISRRDRFRH